MSEGGVAKVTCEWSNIDMTPVVHDQASALGKHGVAVAILADKVRYAPLIVFVDHFNLFI